MSVPTFNGLTLQAAIARLRRADRVAFDAFVAHVGRAADANEVAASHAAMLYPDAFAIGRVQEVVRMSERP